MKYSYKMAHIVTKVDLEKSRKRFIKWIVGIHLISVFTIAALFKLFTH